MRVDPEHTARPVRRGETAERSERDRVVAAENERDLPGARCLGTSAATRAHVSLISGRKRARSSSSAVASGLGAVDVAEVADVVAEARQALLETRSPDRRGSHVDAAAALAEVERGADDRDGSLFGVTERTLTPARLHCDAAAR